MEDNVCSVKTTVTNLVLDSPCSFLELTEEKKKNYLYQLLKDDTSAFFMFQSTYYKSKMLCITAKYVANHVDVVWGFECIDPLEDS